MAEHISRRSTSRVDYTTAHNNIITVENHRLARSNGHLRLIEADIDGTAVIGPETTKDFVIGACS